MHRLPNLLTLRDLLPPAQAKGYAVGAFSPRCRAMIRPVLQAAQRLNSPVIVQISFNELRRYQIQAAAFADRFFRCMREERISVPTALHLDHTNSLGALQEAIDAGFTSVMIDASESPLDENIAHSRAAVELAHARGVSVEAELGRIGTTDFIETEKDEERYTAPGEASYFVGRTGVDALAVSIGTAHGVYRVRSPLIDLERLAAIRALTPVPLVLHGGSGVPPEMLTAAIRLKGGGISKVNVATDLEQAALAALRRTERLTDAQMEDLPPDEREQAGQAVAAVVANKILHFVSSAGRASDHTWEALVGNL